MEAALPLAQSTKLMPGEYGELMKALKKVRSYISSIVYSLLGRCGKAVSLSLLSCLFC